MHLSLSIFSLLFFINAGAVLLLSGYFWSRKNIRGGSFFSILLFGLAIWAFSTGVESISDSNYDIIFWSVIGYIGKVLVGPLWLLFSMSYVSVKKSIIKKINYGIWFIPLICYIIIVTNDYHHLFWKSVYTNASGMHIFERGSFFYVNLFYIYICLIIGVILLIKYFFTSSGMQKWQAVALVGCLLFPWGANFAFIILGAEKLGGYDIAPIAFTITSFIIAFSIIRLKLLEIIPAAKDLAYHSLKNGIIVLDSEKKIIDFNHAAQELIGEGIELNIDIEKADPDINFSKIIKEKKEVELYNPGRLSHWIRIESVEMTDQQKNKKGFVIIIYDITKQRQTMQSLKDAEKFFKDVVDFLPDPTYVLDSSYKVLIWNKAMEVLTGIKAEKIIGHGNYEYALPFFGRKQPMLADFILMKDVDSALFKKYGKIQINGPVLSSEITKEHYDKKDLCLLTAARPLTNAQGIFGAIESFKDITKQRNYEEKMREKVEELSTLNKTMVNREIKMMQLKEELAKYKK
ncbi:MAG: histidine kinase N-terminal 7TM domain-containing protein [Patescibacteria group bacterium]|jgi:PAS domain S-box-containing protein